MGELLAKHMARTARTQPAIWRIFAVLNNHLSRKLADKQEQGSFLHEHARPLDKRCTWRLTTRFAFIKLARLKAIITIILLVGLGECACDLTKCVVCKKTLTWS